MASVRLRIPGQAQPREVNVTNVPELLETLEAPEGYEIKLLRIPHPAEGEQPGLPELLNDNSELHDGDEIDVQPILKGAASIVRPKEEETRIMERIKELIKTQTYTEMLETLKQEGFKNLNLNRVYYLAKKARVSRRQVVEVRETPGKKKVPLLRGA